MQTSIEEVRSYPFIGKIAESWQCIFYARGKGRT
jgi:hypothetical protein